MCFILHSLIGVLVVALFGHVVVVVGQTGIDDNDCFARNSSEAQLRFPSGLNAALTLGVLVPSGPGIGDELEALIRLAAWQVNNDTEMLVDKAGQKRKLCVLSIRSQLDPFSTFQAALRIAANNVFGVVGPIWTAIGDIVAPLANKANLPFISPAAFTTAFHVTQGSGPDSEADMPFLRRICCDNTHTAEVIIDILKHYQWNRVAVLVTDTDYGHSTSQQFSSLARQHDIIILTTEFVPPQIGTTKQNLSSNLLTNIVELKTRIIINFLWDEQILQVLRLANQSSLVGNDYVWLFAELVMERTELQGFISKVPEAVSLFEGVLFTHLSATDRSVYHTNSSLSTVLQQVGVQWYPQATWDNFTLNTYGLLTYDVTMLYALAAHTMLSGMAPNESLQFDNATIVSGQLKLPIFANGSAFLRILNDTVQNGPSGRVRIDQDGVVVRLSTYSIFNAVSNGTVVEVATWKSSRVPGSLAFSPLVRWHGGGTTQPSDEDNSQNQLLRILVPVDDEPFIFYDRSKTGNEAFSGFAIDLLKHFAEEVQFRYNLTLFEGSWDDMVQQVGRPDTKFDMAIGDITVTSYRELVCDFTSSFFQSSYRILVKVPDSQSSSGLWQFFSPFSVGVWFMLLAFLIFSGIMLFILERGHLRHISPGLAETMWVSFSTFYSTQKAEKITSNYGRFYLIVACFIVMVINAAFTANMTSFLLDNDVTLPYANLQQVGSERTGALAGTATYRYLHEVQHVPNLVNISYSKAVQALVDGTIKAFINNEPSQKHLSLNSTGCKVAISGESFHQEKYAFALKRSSPMLAPLNRAILNAWDSGYIEDLYYRRFVWNDPCKTASSDTDALELKNVGGLFIIVTAAAALCLIGHFALARIQAKYPSFMRYSFCLDTAPPLGEMEDDGSTATGGMASVRSKLGSLYAKRFSIG